MIKHTTTHVTLLNETFSLWLFPATDFYGDFLGEVTPHQLNTDKH